MNLIERFKRFWYVPTIEARQAQMLRDVWEIRHNTWARMAFRLLCQWRRQNNGRKVFQVVDGFKKGRITMMQAHSEAMRFIQ